LQVSAVRKNDGGEYPKHEYLRTVKLKESKIFEIEEGLNVTTAYNGYSWTYDCDGMLLYIDNNIIVI
jgi:hypothetical protein